MKDYTNTIVQFQCTKVDGRNNYVMYEKGGSFGDHGYAFLIADKHGKPKAPFSTANIVNGKHACIFVDIGDIICTCSIGEDLIINFYEITIFKDNIAICVLKQEDDITFNNLRRMAIIKASTLYCRNAMYVDMD